MSKQEHDKDEQRAPSGAGKEDAPADAPPATATDDKRASRHADRDATGDGDERAAATAQPGSAKGDADKAEAAGKGGAKAADKDKPKTTGKPADANRPVTPPGKPAGEKAQKPPSSPDKRPDKTTTSAPSGARPSAGGSGGAGTGVATPRHGGGNGGKFGGIALALVVLLILVVLIGGWWGWQKLSAQQQRLAQVASNADAIAQIESQLSQRDQQREQALQRMREELQQYRESVNQTLDQVLAQLASEQEADPSDWLYAEVEYLLRLANQRLQLERDVAGAEALLRTADERLAQADNPALTPVRRAIQSELAALASVPEVDRTGLYLTLMAQQEQLAQLPLEQNVEQIAAEGGDTSPVSGGWREQLARFGQELKELVVVREHDQALEALLTPEQEAYLRQNVRLQLEQAQLALLDANPELYRASLEKAITLIENYYDTDNQGVSETLEQLRTLADQTIRPELPDISGSLQALRDFMERRRDTGSDAAGGSAGSNTGGDGA